MFNVTVIILKGNFSTSRLAWGKLHCNEGCMWTDILNHYGPLPSPSTWCERLPVNSRADELQMKEEQVCCETCDWTCCKLADFLHVSLHRTSVKYIYASFFYLWSQLMCTKIPITQCWKCTTKNVLSTVLDYIFCVEPRQHNTVAALGLAT